MATRVAICACACAFAAIASASVGHIEFYFSTQGDLSSIPPEYTAATTPVVALGQTAYLWAYVQGATERWYCVNMHFDDPEIGFGQMYDPHTPDPDDPTQDLWRRWHKNSDRDPKLDNSIFLVAVPGYEGSGLGDSAEDTLEVEPDTHHFLVGEMSFDTAGQIFMSVGTGYILKWNGSQPPTDDIYFGFAADQSGPDHILRADGQLAYGTDVGAVTPTPDLYIIPEPAAWLLLGLIGLVMQRR